jgi:peptide chain release factor 2
LVARLAELEKKMAEADFWGDPEAAKGTIEEANALKRWSEPLTELDTKLEEAELYREMAAEDDSAEAQDEAARALDAAAALLEQLESRYMLGGPDDDRGAIVEFHPGAGGTESQDWAEMLLRMYTRYCEAQDWEHELLDLDPGEEAGIKSATLEIREPYAYGYLKGESGVHRLVRISPFDAQSRRHTSFASLFVYPLVDQDNIDIDVSEKDLRIDTYRASGAGGQHVNKTSSAVRITHVPTGIVVQCQNQRSQHRNRETAMKMLYARLYQLHLEEEQAKQAELEKSKMKIDFGSQIRSYVLQPYTKVKDHRTDVETGDAQRVLDGDLERFIQAYLRLAGSAS